MTVSVPVALGDRSYQIHIGAGLLASAGELLRPLMKENVRTVPVVTDENVARLHYDALERSLTQAGLKSSAIVLSPGEQTKSFPQLEKLSDALLDANVERDGMVIALGGGVIGDLVGFAAGILKRGVSFAQIPTTVLAQVDSSVGGKTAINTRQGKNLVGVFHQPRIVIADVATLSTLSPREVRGGYAEIVKYGLLGDADFFSWLEKNGAAALAGDTRAMIHAVSHSCTMKAAIVARDERETGERALLNLGHTFGHALEAATGFSDALIHGEGVALGCVLAFKLSASLGLCSREDAQRVERHFAKSGLRTRIKDVGGGDTSPDALLAHMRHDKKASGGKMTFILARGIGKAFITRDVGENDVRAVLAEN